MQRHSALIIGLGYLGSRVARLWTESGLQVLATTRSRHRFESIRRMGVEPVHWDVNVGGDRLPSVQTVLYDVGFDRSQGRDRRQVYVEGLENTLAHLPRPERFIYISTTGVYGDHAGAWVDETTPTRPLDESGQVCLAAEQVLWDFAATNHWAAVVLRLAGIYGPGRLIGADRLRAGEAIAGDPEGCLNLIHVEDAARAVECARLRGRAGETYLVSDGHPVVRRDFYAHLAGFVGAPEPKFDPGSASRYRGDRKVSNRKMMEELRPNLAYDSFTEGLKSSLVG